jgi:hypothetical protein
VFAFASIPSPKAKKITCLMNGANAWISVLKKNRAEFSPSIERLNDYVAGGESKTYVFEIPEDQEPGVQWYHNHVHGNSAYSYMANLFGILVIEGTDRDITKAPGVEGATEIFMILSEGLVNEDKSVALFLPIVFEFGWSSAANGALGAETKHTFTQGETVLFRVASATVEPTIRLAIPDHKMIIVAYDGLPVPAPEKVDVVPLSGGNRVEFLVRFDQVGTFTMSRLPWSLVPDSASCLFWFGVDTYPCLSFDLEQLVATIEVVPAEGGATPSSANNQLIDRNIELPGYSARKDALASQESVAKKTIILQLGPTSIFENLGHGGPPVPPGKCCSLDCQSTSCILLFLLHHFYSLSDFSHIHLVFPKRRYRIWNQ